MTVCIGPTALLSRQLLEAASPQQRAGLLAARARHVGNPALGPVSRAERVEADLLTARQRRLEDVDTTADPRADPSTEPEVKNQEAVGRRSRRPRQARVRRVGRLGGTWRPEMVDVTHAREHLQALHTMGYSAAVLSALTHVDQAQILRLLSDIGDGSGQRWIQRERERQILEAEFDLDLIPDTCRVPNWPTRRRIHALQAIGWPLQAIADRAGITRQAVDSTARAETVRADLARRYQAIYLALEGTSGSSQRARTEARRKGWPPPAAWDDIDDPAEQPDPSRWIESTDLGSARRRIYLDNLEDCVSWGLDIAAAAHRLGVTSDAITLCAERAGRPDVLERLHRNRQIGVA